MLGIVRRTRTVVRLSATAASLALLAGLLSTVGPSLPAAADTTPTPPTTTTSSTPAVMSPVGSPAASPNFVTGTSTEITSARTAFSRTFQNPDGSQTPLTSLEPMNYQNSTGAWEQINDAVVTDPSVPGGLRSAANAWRAHFEPLPTGLVVNTADGQQLSFSPVGASAVAPQVADGGAGVIYPNAWPGVDLEYLVLPDRIKEEIVVNKAPSTSSFAFATGSMTYGSDGGGNLTPTGATGQAASLEAPIVFGASGRLLPSAAPTLVASGSGSTHRVTVSVASSLWSSLSASTYPVVVDPSVVFGSSNLTAYDSNSSAPAPCGNCGLRIGDDGAQGNPDRYWRSVGYFDYSSIDGDYVSAASIQLGNLYNSAPFSFTISSYHASAYSYAGAVSGAVLAQAPGGTSVNLTGSALTSAYQGWVGSSTNGAAIGFQGLEYAGNYSFQEYLSYQLTLTYYRYPGQPAGRSVTPCSSNCAAPVLANSATPTLTGNTTDPDGLNLNYNFQVWAGWSSSPTTLAASGTVSNVPSGTGASWTVNTALSNAANYEYRVQACVNAAPAACGPWSNGWVDFTIDTTGEPTNVVAFPGSGQAEVTWTVSPYKATPPIDSYVIVAYPASGSPSSVTVNCDNTLTCTSGVVPGLVNGVQVAFLVYPHNANGYGPPGVTTANITPSTAATPYPVMSMSAWPGNADAFVTWTAPPTNGGPALAGYYVDAFSYTTSCQFNSFVSYQFVSASTTSMVYPGLINGTKYCFVVFPDNSSGYVWTTNGSVSGSVTPTASPSPFPPLNATASAGNGVALVQWTANPSGAAPTSYIVAEYTYNNEVGAYVSQQTVTPPVTDAVFTGLTNGSQYVYIVYAVNSDGNAFAITNLVTPTSSAGGAIAPTNASAIPADSAAVVTWTAPILSVTGVTTYSVNVYQASTGTQVATYQAGTATSSCSTGSPSDPPQIGPEAAPCAVVTGLTNGTSYYFTISASTAGLQTGTSTATAPVTPAGKPFAPTITTVNNVPPAGGQAQVNWTAPPTQTNGVPGNNGSPIISYTITATPTGGGNPNASTVTTTFNVPSPDPGSYSDTVGGILNGTTYNITVAATNSVGTSGPSNTVSFTPAGVPFPPTITSVNNVPPAGGQAAVNWTSPPTQSNGVSGNNGSPITSYTITATPVSGSNPQATTVTTTYIVPSPDPGSYSDTISGLLNGTTYGITVTATNSIGTSNPSGTIDFAPVGTPYAPMGVSAGLDGDATGITVSWSAPSTQSNGVPGNNGSSIATYTVTEHNNDGNPTQTQQVSGSTLSADFQNLPPRYVHV
jgi:hypothetical protein